MPNDDWSENSVPELFMGWKAWPWPWTKHDARYEGLQVCYPDPRSVLDVACGLSLKSKFIPTKIRVGLDIHRPYLEAVETDEPWIPICADVTKIHELFFPNTFDLVVALDIVEHLEKEEALDLIKRLEEIAKIAVVLETPRGLLPQNLDILGFDQHHLQTHRCGFEKEELEDLGYQVFVRDYKLAPVKRHTDEPIAAECQLLNAIKRVDQ